MRVAFAVIFMALTEKQLQTSYKLHRPFLWKRYIDDIFVCGPFPKPKATTSLSLLTNSAPPLDSRMNSHQKKIVFLDTEVFKGPRFTDSKIVDV